tara:strand:- start:220 stop:504 length:285 start_codon:yes stop_codon:yes gene_type:complete
MKFEPTNRHILVNLIEEKKQKDESLIYLPEEYKKPESPFALCSVQSVASDSKFINSLKSDDNIVIERRMLQKIDVQGVKFYLILDNYILGRVEI